MADTWQTLTQACQTLGISQRTLYRRIDKGEIETKLEDNRRLVWVSPPDVKPLAEVTNNVADTVIATLKDENEDLKQQLQEKDSQIAELQTTNRTVTTERESLKTENERRDSQIAELQADNQYLREELRQKGQLVAVAQNTAQQLIERLQTPFWKRWFRRQKALPQGDVVDMEAENENQP